MSLKSQKMNWRIPMRTWTWLWKMFLWKRCTTTAPSATCEHATPPAAGSCAAAIRITLSGKPLSISPVNISVTSVRQSTSRRYRNFAKECCNRLIWQLIHSIWSMLSLYILWMLKSVGVLYCHWVIYYPPLLFGIKIINLLSLRHFNIPIERYSHFPGSNLERLLWLPTHTPLSQG